MINNIINIIVRLCGLGVMFLGLALTVKVFDEAYMIYQQPTRVERIAIAIEAASNIDKILNSQTDKQEQKTTAEHGTQNIVNIRISYFIAWIISMLVLLMLGKISLTAIKIGGELALYDAQIKKFARELLRQQATPKKSKSSGKSEKYWRFGDD